MPIIVDDLFIKRHKALQALFKRDIPVENAPSTLTSYNKKEYGVRKVVIEIAEDWQSAAQLTVNDFPSCVYIEVNLFKITGSRIKLLDQDDPRHGHWHKTYQTAMDHFADAEKWFKGRILNQAFNGCGAWYCHFCNEFKKTNIIPSSVPPVPQV